MPSLLRPDVTTYTGLERTVLPVGPVLVASDASVDSDAAFPLAQVVAAHAHAEVQVITAIQPYPIPIYGLEGVSLPPEVNADMKSDRGVAIRAQMARALPTDVAWHVTVTEGDPIREIVRHARSSNARVLVVGRGRHDLPDRILGGESVLRLLQYGDTPVIAVEPGLRTLPKRVVIATDFSAFGLYAAQVGMTIVAPDATVHLVHVRAPAASADPMFANLGTESRERTEDAFAMWRERLASGGVTFREVSLEGSVGDALRRYAQSIDAELIVTATHGYGFLRRAVLGSVASDLVRHASCSLLIVPGSARTLAAARAQSFSASMTRTSTFAIATLDHELSAFTKRNAGRSGAVEIDRLDFGAQILGHDLPLVGATFEKDIATATFMFGASTLEGQHLTHSITGVTAIELSTNADGRDDALRIVHASGHTLILLH